MLTVPSLRVVSVMSRTWLVGPWSGTRRMTIGSTFWPARSNEPSTLPSSLISNVPPPGRRIASISITSKVSGFSLVNDSVSPSRLATVLKPDIQNSPTSSERCSAW